MKNLHLISCFLFFLIFVSCSDVPQKKEPQDSIELVKIISSEESSGSYIYTFNGSEYELSDGEEKGYPIYKFSDGTIINGEVIVWEKPDTTKGEYTKWIIEKIDNNSAVLKLEDYSETLGKQNWRFNFKFKRGNYEDYLLGKTVELEAFPNEMEKYCASLGKGYIAVFSKSGFDPVKSKASINMKNYLLRINKKEIISTFDSHGTIQLFISSELHKEMLIGMKENLGN
jgi:hypothetical protein